MSTAPDKLDQKTTDKGHEETHFHIKLVSFGYKQGPAPSANAVFDVRFLKNPYWVEELRPLTGRELPVQEYVMNQKAASEFIDSLVELLSRLFPELAKSDFREFSIAFGCTGGQHRSTTMVEQLARRLNEQFPDIKVERFHRELDGKHAEHRDLRKTGDHPKAEPGAGT